MIKINAEILRVPDGLFMSKVNLSKPNGGFIPEPHKPVFAVEPNKTYMIAVDPGSISLGLVIADVENKYPLYCMNLLRSDAEYGTNDFTEHFRVFLETLLQTKHATGEQVYKFIKVERPFFDNKRGADTYQVLKSLYDTCNNLGKLYGCSVFQSPPQSWKSKYLTPVKYEWGLNLSKSNKQAIFRRGVEYLRQYPFYGVEGNSYTKNIEAVINYYTSSSVKKDWFDALGLMRVFFEDDYTTDGTIKVTPALPKTLKSVRYYCLPYKADEPDDDVIMKLASKPSGGKSVKTFSENKEYYSTYLTNAFGRTPNVRYFEYCPSISLKDNIRALVEFDNYGLFFSIVPIEISLFQELYKSNYPFKNISPSTVILLVGFWDK